jgi:hypothetical protein
LDKTGDFQLFDDAFGRDGWEHGGRHLRYLPNGTWFCQVHLKITAQQTINECHVLRRAHNYLVIAGYLSVVNESGRETNLCPQGTVFRNPVEATVDEHDVEVVLFLDVRQYFDEELVRHFVETFTRRLGIS